MPNPTLAAALAAPPPPSGQAITWDGPVGARVTAAGARALIVDYRLNGARHRKVLPTMDPAAAKVLAAEWKALAKRGVDPSRPGAKVPKVAKVAKPARAPKAAAAPAPAGPLFLEAAQAFLAHGRKKKGKELRPRTAADYQAALLVQAAPLHDRPLNTIMRADIAQLIGAVAREKAARGEQLGKATWTGATTARKLRAALSRLWSWAIANGHVEYSPVVGTEAHATDARDRVLTDVEIAALWAATTDRDDFDLIVRLALWTGARRTEIGSMRWREMGKGGEGDVWKVPGSRTKNGRPLVLPLPRQAVAALGRRWDQRKPDRDFVFGRPPRSAPQKPQESRKSAPQGAGGFSGWSKSLERLQAKSGVTGFGLHDLRRTAQTRMAKLGVRPDIVNRVLNHAVDKITATYDQHTYLDEKRKALQKWADELDRIVGAAPAQAA